MRTVFNLADGQKMTFSDDVTPSAAVRICFAQERNRMTEISTMIHEKNMEALDESFPCTWGGCTVSCGDWATLI